MHTNSTKTQKWMRDVLQCRDEAEIDSQVDLIMAECQESEPPFLSDLLIGVNNGGQPILIALGDREKAEMELSDDERFRWKIQVLRDEWGNEPVPGEFVERVIQKNLYKKEGKPVPATDLSAAKVDGSYSRKYERRLRYEVDGKGCIVCGFSAAMYFLTVYGVHSVTGYALTTKPEHSTGVSKAPNGNQLHVWYWRYKEMDTKAYKVLAPVEVTKVESKRGHK